MKERPMQFFDVIGVGFGPANIALAIALEEMTPGISSRFIEARPQPSWQPGMLLSGSDIQHNPIRDLATLRNPRSRFTFINYLHETGRLPRFLNVPMHYPLRKEYERYVKWVAGHFAENVSYGHPVINVDRDERGGGFTVQTQDGSIFGSRALVLAPGRTPYIPDAFAAALGDRVFHLQDYLPRISAFSPGAPERLAVVGGSQSAVELLLDLRDRFPRCHIDGIHRNFSYRLKDTSPFTEDIYLPDSTDFYFGLTGEERVEMRRSLLFSNYSAADGDVLCRLYNRIYEDELDGCEMISVKSCTNIISAERHQRRVRVAMERRYSPRTTEQADYDAVILATGFRDLGRGAAAEPYPPLLERLAGVLALGRDGSLSVNRDYSVGMRGQPDRGGLLFLNGLCESSHGLGDAGSFSLLSLRAGTIAQAIDKRLHRPAHLPRPPGANGKPRIFRDRPRAGAAQPISAQANGRPAWGIKEAAEGPRTRGDTP
jgi:L-ornithine N5-oxygenase